MASVFNVVNQYSPNATLNSELIVHDIDILY